MDRHIRLSWDSRNNSSSPVHLRPAPVSKTPTTYLKRPASIDDIVSTLRRIDSANEAPVQRRICHSNPQLRTAHAAANRTSPTCDTLVPSCRDHRAGRSTDAVFPGRADAGKRHRALSCCGGSYITTFSAGDGSSVSSKTRIRWPRYQRPFGSGATRTPGRHGLLRPGYLPGSRKTSAGARSRRRTDRGRGGRTPQVHRPAREPPGAPRRRGPAFPSGATPLPKLATPLRSKQTPRRGRPPRGGPSPRSGGGGAEAQI